jgi:7TM diverse intracellular signalling
MLKNYAIYGLILWFCAPCKTQTPFVLKSGMLPKQAITIFTDTQIRPFQEVKYKINQPLHRDSSDLRIAPDSIAWLRFVCLNLEPQTEWAFFVENNNIRHSILYDKAGKILDEGGYAARYSTKKFVNQHCWLRFNLDSAQIDTFYMCIDNRGFRTNTYLGVAKYAERIETFAIEGYEMGVFSGVLLVYTCFALILGLQSQKWLQFYYLFYVMGALFYFIASIGLGYWLFWADNPRFEERAFLLGAAWTMAGYFMVVRSFLELSIKMPHFNKIIIGVIAYSGIMMCASLPNPIWRPQQFAYDVMNIIFFIALILIALVMLSGKARLSHKRENWLFIFAFLPILISICSILYCEFDFSRYRILQYYNEYIQYSMGLEILLMGVLITLRFRQTQLTLQKEKQWLEYKLNLERYEKEKQTLALKLAAEKEIQEEKDNNFSLVHNFLKNFACIVLDSVKYKYPKDNELILMLQKMIEKCNVGQIFIQEAQLGAFIQQIANIFKKTLNTEERIFDVYGLDEPMIEKMQVSSKLRYQLMLFISEALGNMHKYAKHDYASLNLSVVKDSFSMVLLQIEDNGMGLPMRLKLEVDEITLTQENYILFCDTYLMESNGIRDFFKIAHRIGATLTIHSKRQKGTNIKLIFVLNT